MARGASGAGSTGLGLDIARRTAEAAGGSLRIAASPRGGARIELDLPAAPG
ncbi:MAG TPA: ATP-binding protein [Acidimicrobiia bacterium]